MSFQIRVQPAAGRDVEDLFFWSEEQAPGLGPRFVAELDAVYARLIDAPLAYAQIYRETRRALLKKFPVGVFYVEARPTIHVIAVSHLARHPPVWQSRS